MIDRLAGSLSNSTNWLISSGFVRWSASAEFGVCRTIRRRCGNTAWWNIRKYRRREELQELRYVSKGAVLLENYLANVVNTQPGYLTAKKLAGSCLTDFWSAYVIPLRLSEIDIFFVGGALCWRSTVISGTTTENRALSWHEVRAGKSTREEGAVCVHRRVNEWIGVELSTRKLNSNLNKQHRLTRESKAEC